MVELNILFLTQIVPFPPDSGPKVKTWHVLRYLASKGYRVILASYIRPEEQQYVPQLRQVCSEVYTVPIHRSQLANVRYWLRSQLTRRPYLVERDDQKAMRNCIEQILATHSIDCIHADQFTMAQFSQLKEPFQLGEKRPRLVFDDHNAVWTIVERMVDNVPWYLRPIVKLEASRVKQYEGSIVDSFDHTLAVTEIDRQYLMEAQKAYLKSSRRVGNGQSPQKVSVIPIAVDTEKLTPVQRTTGKKNIFTMGTLHYPPNADGIRWFVKEVFPLIRSANPDVQLKIAGRNPPPDFLQFGQESNGAIIVTGYLPELRPTLEETAAMVVPVRAGSGMRVRILEAFAQAMPVVTTTVGLEGIEARPGHDVLVADTPEDFAVSVIKLVNDESLQMHLAANGRKLAENRYDWKVVLQRMDSIYGS